MARVFVSIGSNIDRERNVAAALERLGGAFGALEQSTVYETEAVGFEGDPFYNLVVGFDTDLGPREVADLLHRIEDEQERERHGARFGARTLDLDLLLYDELVLDEADLRLPRPEILEYAFVLRPLAEIAGERIHPLTGASFAAMWDAFDPKAQPMWPVRK
ncbi:MAG: 2-amino-4-hydroxy-6-hydroxymethyldihydropteridine diphosphokinase [Gammaproteobacteria bacterium]